jgi:lipopolysaccharide export system ATP-binding protein
MPVASCLLEADGLSKILGGRAVLERVSLRVEAGEVVGLLGPNGAGKTTLLRVLLGLLVPDAGRIHWCGADIGRWPTYRRARAGIGYLPQEPSSFLGLSARHNLEAVLELNRRPRAEAAPMLEALGLWPRRDQRAQTLSGGERRRLEIARLLVLRPRLLLLDEPQRGLDQRAREVLREELQRLAGEGSGVVIVEHPGQGADGAADGALALCQRFCVMTDGRLADGARPALPRQGAGLFHDGGSGAATRPATLNV